jgi:hypothetical protein
MLKATQALMLSLLTLSACQSAPSSPNALEAGWRPYPTIRAFDPPGRIIRKEANGAIYGVGVLPVTNARCGGEEFLPEVKKTSKFKIGDVLETIGVAKEALPATFNAELSRTADYEVSSISGTRECLDDRDIDPIIARIADYFAQNQIMVRDDNEYYIVRETLATKQLKFKSDKNWLGNLGVDARFKQQVENKAKLEWGSGTTYTIDKTFDQPMRVWYRAEKLNIKPALGAGPGQFSVSLAGVTDEQLIKEGPISNAP